MVMYERRTRANDEVWIMYTCFNPIDILYVSYEWQILKSTISVTEAANLENRDEDTNDDKPQ